MRAGETLPGACTVEVLAGGDIIAGQIVRLSGARAYPAVREWTGVACNDAKEHERVRVVYAGTVAVRTGSRGEFTGWPRWADGVIVNATRTDSGPMRAKGKKLRGTSFVNAAAEPGAVAISLSSPEEGDPRWSALVNARR